MSIDSEIQMGERAMAILQKRKEELRIARQVEKAEEQAEVFERFKQYMMNDFGAAYTATTEKFYKLVALKEIDGRISITNWWLLDDEVLKHRFEHIEFSKYADRWVDLETGMHVIKEMEVVFEKSEAKSIADKLAEFISKPELMEFHA